MPSLSRRFAVCSRQIASAAIARHKEPTMNSYATIVRPKQLAAAATKPFLALGILVVAMSVLAGSAWATTGPQITAVSPSYTVCPGQDLNAGTFGGPDSKRTSVATRAWQPEPVSDADRARLQHGRAPNLRGRRSPTRRRSAFRPRCASELCTTSGRVGRPATAATGSPLIEQPSAQPPAMLGVVQQVPLRTRSEEQRRARGGPRSVGCGGDPGVR